MFYTRDDYSKLYGEQPFPTEPHLGWFEWALIGAVAIIVGLFWPR